MSILLILFNVGLIVTIGMQYDTIDSIKMKNNISFNISFAIQTFSFIHIRITTHLNEMFFALECLQIDAPYS